MCGLPVRAFGDEERQNERYGRRGDPEDDRRVEIVARHAVQLRFAGVDEPAADDVLQAGADVARHADDSQRGARRFARYDVDGHQAAQKTDQHADRHAEQNHAEDIDDQPVAGVEEQAERDGVQHTEAEGQHVAPPVEEGVGEPARKDRAHDAAERIDRNDLRGRGQRIAFDLLQEKHAPAVDRIAADIHERAGERQHPDQRIADHGALQVGSFAVVAGRAGSLFAGQLLDRGQPFRFGGVVHQQYDRQYAEHAGDRRAYESPLPAEEADDRADEQERQEFAEVVAGAEESVVGAPLAERVPPREGDDGRGRAHRLAPAVDAPHDGEGDEQHHVADDAASVGQAEDADQQVGDRRYRKTRGHEAFDVAVVGEESVDEFADGVGEQQRRTDDAQLRGVQRPAFEDGLFHHVETRAADVIETVADGAGDEALPAEFFVETHHGVVVLRQTRRRCAFSEK